jgi:hypothetical protein
VYADSIVSGKDNENNGPADDVDMKCCHRIGLSRVRNALCWRDMETLPDTSAMSKRKHETSVKLTVNCGCAGVCKISPKAIGSAIYYILYTVPARLVDHVSEYTVH